MAEFTITAVKPEPRVWEGEHGTFHIYDVEFQGDTASGKGQIKQKATTAPPTVGMKNDYDLVRKGDYPPELKRIQQQGGGGGGFRGKSPEESNRIARMNSHGHALKYWELKHAGNPQFGFAGWGDYLAIVDLFYNDIKGAS